MNPVNTSTDSVAFRMGHFIPGKFRSQEVVVDTLDCPELPTHSAGAIGNDLCWKLMHQELSVEALDRPALSTPL